MRNAAILDIEVPTLLPSVELYHEHGSPLHGVPSSERTSGGVIIRITVLMPAYEEEALIASTIEAAREALGARGKVTFIVADDGSGDGTAQAARDAGAVVMGGKHAGKGGALNRVVPTVRDVDIVVLLDADLGSTASGIAPLVDAILDDECDMAIATFAATEGSGGFGFVKRLALATIQDAVGTQVELTTPLSGQRALTKECFEAVVPFASGYGVDIATTIDAIRAGYRVHEVATDMTSVATGRSIGGFLHRFRQYMDIKRLDR